MPKIHVLPEEVVKKIAAGEVVERPASVLKELVENSLDAHAHRIDVYVEEGGKKLIKVWDDGEGIEKDDLSLAVQVHTTSKITHVGDLFDLSTYGFRGEALASICGVAKVTIHTRHKDSKIGYEYRVWQEQISPKPREVGTTVTVEDLFYNVPARRRFLRSTRTELNHIKDTFAGLALVNVGKEFSLYVEGRLVTKIAQGDDVAHRFAKLYKIAPEDLLEFSASGSGLSIESIWLKPAKTLDYPRVLKIILNGRVIEDPGISRAVTEVFSLVLPPDVKPTGVLSINVPNTWVDFNVHPRKIRVRFINAYRFYAILKRLLEEFVHNRASKIKAPTTFVLPTPSLKVKGAEIPLELRDGGAGGVSTSSSKFQSVLGGHTPESRVFTETPAFAQAQSSVDVWDNKIADRDISEAINKDQFKVFQVFNKYVLVELEDTLLFLDQHAAAERIRFEELLGKLEDTKEPNQHLLSPIVINASNVDRNIAQLLNELGFEYRVEGDRLVVSAIPTFLSPIQAKSFLVGVLSIEPLETPDNDLAKKVQELREYIIATKACHTAVRAQERLSEKQARDLVKRLFRCRVPVACPHGRPTYWMLSKDKLDSFFWRTY